jgi:hypothetical protein
MTRENQKQLLEELTWAKRAVQQIIHDTTASWQDREKARIAAVQAQNLIDNVKKGREMPSTIGAAIARAVGRAITGNPRCAYCTRDGIWSRSGIQVCDEHRDDLRACGFEATPRRH